MEYKSKNPHDIYAAIILAFAFMYGVTFPATASSLAGVEGVIEGRILKNGQPVKCALIASCYDSRRGKPNEQECDSYSEVRTDSAGRFAIRQATGFAPPAKKNMESAAKVLKQLPAWGYGFLIEFQGATAMHFKQGRGYARSRVRLTCDLSSIQDQPKKNKDAIGEHDDVPFIECVTSETMAKPK
jgi:hypothetical protein